jgi:hypothetical protein
VGVERFEGFGDVTEEDQGGGQLAQFGAVFGLGQGHDLFEAPAAIALGWSEAGEQRGLAGLDGWFGFFLFGGQGWWF